ncbi:hypothetical protein J5Y09_14390 [Roseomonas sp. PWR1]|uniref:Uncharacterized protein n=1 Tax=Roseomonas nitratireducens TaxID=2820810 RepID=A0ABS4AUR5_9PROT|nr:hypothetical protein [Neoroseomonas nitratireducens]MBP0465110.1 hypothetical protein [Neoroseomonas nitratireducens]
MGWRRPVILAALLLPGCAAPAPPPDGRLHVALDIAGRVERRGVAMVAPGDAMQRCSPPARRAGVGADGYGVTFGPRFLPEAGTLAPEWRAYGPQQRFSLLVFPAADAAADGPVRLGRGFRIQVGTPEGLWERTVAEDAPAAEGEVAIAPDGLAGRFRARGLVLQVPHNALPDTEAISVSGTWRCPAP